MHHEMVNGAGYPQKLRDAEIPLQAKIISVADTFDAMTTDRPYQKAMETGVALERINTFIGTRYDERVVAALAAAIDSGQISAGRVKLRSRHPMPATADIIQPQTASSAAPQPLSLP